jgi:hypothetical protein
MATNESRTNTLAGGGQSIPGAASQQGRAVVLTYELVDKRLTASLVLADDGSRQGDVRTMHLSDMSPQKIGLTVPALWEMLDSARVSLECVVVLGPPDAESVPPILELALGVPVISAGIAGLVPASQEFLIVDAPLVSPMAETPEAETEQPPRSTAAKPPVMPAVAQPVVSDRVRRRRLGLVALSAVSALAGIAVLHVQGGSSSISPGPAVQSAVSSPVNSLTGSSPRTPAARTPSPIVLQGDNSFRPVTSASTAESAGTAVIAEVSAFDLESSALGAPGVPRAPVASVPDIGPIAETRTRTSPVTRGDTPAPSVDTAVPVQPPSGLPEDNPSDAVASQPETSIDVPSAPAGPTAPVTEEPGTDSSPEPPVLERIDVDEAGGE